MIFIKLTLKNDGKTVFVNAEKIVDLFENDDKKGTTLSFNGNEFCYNVKESPEEIMNLIKQEEERNFEVLELQEAEVDRDLLDKLEGYLKDFIIKYNFKGDGMNDFKIKANDDIFEFQRTCYPEINDCIQASFRYMDNYLKHGKFNILV